MRIKSFIHDCILNAPFVPPETGGIIGGTKGIITEFFFDEGHSVNDHAAYIPDIGLINSRIQRWQEEGISFYGMYHTHPDHQETLSGDDVLYIKEIMRAMPDNVPFLYFPVVIPKQKIIPYKATIVKDTVYLTEDILHILR